MTAIAHSLPDRLTLALDGLCRAVAARIAGGALQAAMIVLIWRRVKRTQGKVLALLARFRAGRLWVRTVTPGRGRRGAGRAAAARLPRGFAWLLPMVPYEAAALASQIRGVLDEPEMGALLAASAQARRVLAPLCRMLGIESEAVGVRPAPVAPAARVRAKRVRKARAKVDWGRIPLPRGVLSWARREGFGKVPRG